MKGFIEINVCDNNAILININQIDYVCQKPDNVEIYIIGYPQTPWIVKDSYKEIVNKIKEATE